MSESCSVVSNSLQPHGLYSSRNSPGQNSGVGSFSLLQGIFPTQGSNLGLPYCRQILYQLSHKGSPRILEWVAYPFSRGSSQCRNQTRVSCIAGGFFMNWAIREAQFIKRIQQLQIYMHPTSEHLNVLTGLKGEIDNNKIVARDFNIPSNEQIIQTENQKHWNSTTL